LQAIRNNIFLVEGPVDVVPVCSTHRASVKVHQILECYNFSKEDQDEEDLRNIEIPETKGERVVEGPDIGSIAYSQPLRMHKVNIGTKENPKFAHIGDY
jgi:hypothetical protein